MKECDLILKGGVTSGVVYPKALTKIGEHYRLRSIGGTSAGSMAAALAAAAEYRRQASDTGDFSGYEAFTAVDDDLATQMAGMLQPSSALKPVFDIMIDYLENGGLGDRRVDRAKRLWKYYRWLAPYRKDAKPAAMRNGGLLAGGGVLASVALGGGAFAGAGMAAGVGLYAIQVLYKMVRQIETVLKDHDFGLLPGPTQVGHQTQGVIDWLADKIDIIAGNWPDGRAPEKPLTAKELNAHGIVLSAVTTDLSSQRPFQLPFKVPKHHYFRKDELNAVIPARVVDWMITNAEGQEIQVTIDGRSETLYPLPHHLDFPVILTTRMSMSFPGLIQAVPLWRLDTEIGSWTRCLFSDGGISSNLPVHMFDAWLPSRPTFAVSLGSYDPARHGPDGNGIANRVVFSDAVESVLEYPAYRIDGLLGFLASMFFTAKDWRDRLQSNLTGFNERVATIFLDRGQGGLNLKMTSDQIKTLQSYGALAGEKIVTDFDFDENRFRRALSILPIVGQNLEAVAKRMNTPPTSEADKPIKTYLDVLKTHVSDEFEQSAAWRKDGLVKFANTLAALGAADEVVTLKAGHLPHTDAKLSLTASPDMTDPDRPGGEQMA